MRTTPQDPKPYSMGVGHTTLTRKPGLETPHLTVAFGRYRCVICGVSFSGNMKSDCDIRRFTPRLDGENQTPTVPQ